MLRDRAASHYHARSLFGGSHRLGGRRLAVDRQTVMDRGVGVMGRRAFSAIPSSLKVKEIEGTPLLDRNALKALIRLLRVAQVIDMLTVKIARSLFQFYSWDLNSVNYMVVLISRCLGSCLSLYHFLSYMRYLVSKLSFILILVHLDWE